MIKRLGSYLASRPERAAVLVLVLIVVLVLVIAGFALQWSHFGQSPYPSEKVGFSLVEGDVVFTLDSTYLGFNYTGMKIAFRIDYGGGSGTTVGEFGNQSQLSTQTSATMHQSLMESSFINVSMDLIESTGDGAFDAGDGIVFEITPLTEDWVYTMGLLFVSEHGGRMTMELSFAVHDGKLYAWNSHYLNTDEPWFGSVDP